MVTAVMLVGLYTLQFSRAATGRLYLTPANTTVAQGGSVAIAFRIDPGTDVNGAGGELTYDPNKLELVGFNDNGTAFPYNLESDTSAGKVRTVRATDGTPVNTDSLIMNFTFRVLASSGSIPIILVGNAALYETYTNPTVEGTTITVPAPSPTTPSPQSPTKPPQSATPSPTPAPTPSTPEQTPETNQPTTSQPVSPGTAIWTPTTDIRKPKPSQWPQLVFAMLLVSAGAVLLIYIRRVRQVPPPAPPQSTAPPPPPTAIDKIPWPKAEDPGTIIRPKR